MNWQTLKFSVLSSNTIEQPLDYEPEGKKRKVESTQFIS